MPFVLWAQLEFDEGEYLKSSEICQAGLAAVGQDMELSYLYGRALGRYGEQLARQFTLEKAMDFVSDAISALESAIKDPTELEAGERRVQWQVYDGLVKNLNLRAAILRGRFGTLESARYSRGGPNEDDRDTARAIELCRLWAREYPESNGKALRQLAYMGL